MFRRHDAFRHRPPHPLLLPIHKTDRTHVAFLVALSLRERIAAKRHAAACLLPRSSRGARGLPRSSSRLLLHGRSSMKSALAWLQQNDADLIADLGKLVAIPSIS